MKMKKSDIGVVIAFYAITAFFYAQTVKLKASIQTYPKFIEIVLFGLTTFYLIQMIVNAKKHGVESRNEDFKDFQPAQFFGCLVFTILYLLAVNYIGFYVSTLVFLVVSLLYLKVKPLPTAIATVSILLLVYLAFTLFLKVKLPRGILF